MHPRPHLGLLPGIQATPAGDPAAATQFAWQMPPCDPGDEDIDDPVQHRSIGYPWSATTVALGRGGNQWRHQSPEVVINELGLHPRS